MKNKGLFVLSIIIISSIISCSEKQGKQNIAVTDSTIVTNAPDSFIIRFLKWYQQNNTKLNSIHLVKGGGANTTNFYAIDFGGTEQYLTELRKSGFFSEAYLTEMKNYFSSSDRYFLQHPQNDGPPWGFEADLVMKAQDYKEVWDNLTKAFIVEKSISNGKAIIKMAFGDNYKTTYFLSQLNGKWMLDKIENDTTNSL